MMRNLMPDVKWGFKRKLLRTEYLTVAGDCSLHLGRDSSHLYEKTVDHLALYASTQFKNVSDMVMCLCSGEYVKPEKPSKNDKKRWHYKSAGQVQINQVLKKYTQPVYCTYGLCNTDVFELPISKYMFYSESTQTDVSNLIEAQVYG